MWRQEPSRSGVRMNEVESRSRTSAQIAGRGGHGRNLGGRDRERVHRTAREGAEPAVWIQEHAFGGIETEGRFDGAPNLRRRLNLVRPGIDDAKAQLSTANVEASLQVYSSTS